MHHDSRIFCRRLGPALTLLVLCGWTLGGCGQGKKKEAPPPPQVTVVHPVRREVTEWDEYTARLQSPEAVEVRARVGGYLEAVHFEDGQVVHKSDPLFTIDQRPFINARDQAQAALEQAQAQSNLAEVNFQRQQDLRKKGVIAADAFDQAQNTVKTTAANFAQAKAALQNAQLNLAYSEIKAPVTGRIGRHLVSVGNLVSGGDTASATLLTTIVTLDPIYAYFEVDENSYLSYQKMMAPAGQMAVLDEKEVGSTVVEMELPDENKFQHQGRLNFVDNQIDSSTATIQLRATFPNPRLLLTPGLFTHVRLPARPRHEAILVPDRAVATDQSRDYVNIVDPSGKVKFQPVKLGPIAQDLRVIRDGLKTQDQVIVSGLTSISPGSKVRVKATTIDQFMKSTVPTGDTSDAGASGNAGAAQKQSAPAK